MSDELLKEFGFIIDEDDDGYFFETIDGEDHVRVKPFVGVIWKALSAARAEVERLRESINAKYWEGIANDNAKLRETVKTLRSRLRVVEDAAREIERLASGEEMGDSEDATYEIVMANIQNIVQAALSPEASKPVCEWKREYEIDSPAAEKYKTSCGSSWLVKVGYGSIPSKCPMCHKPVEKPGKEGDENG